MEDFVFIYEKKRVESLDQKGNRSHISGTAETRTRSMGDYKVNSAVFIKNKR